MGVLPWRVKISGVYGHIFRVQIHNSSFFTLHSTVESIDSTVARPTFILHRYKKTNPPVPAKVNLIKYVSNFPQSRKKG